MTDESPAEAIATAEEWECGSCGCTDAEVVGLDVFAYHEHTCPELLGTVSDAGDVERLAERLKARGITLSQYSHGPWLIHWATSA